MSKFFKKEILLTFVLWSFFSMALVKLLAVLLFAGVTRPVYTISIFCLYSLLSFSYYFINKKLFFVTLNYTPYIIYNLLFSVLIALYSYLYFKLVMLNNDYFSFGLYTSLIVTNAILGSLLYLFTLIKKSEI